MSLQWSVVTALRSVNGPGLCRPCTRDVPSTGVALWLAGILAVGVGVWLAARAHRLAATLLPAAVALSTAFPYLFLIDYSAPRFLLPAYALLVLPIAVALVALRRTRLRAVVTVVVVGLLAYQGVVLEVIVRNSLQQRARWEQVVSALEASGVRPPCTLSGTEALPLAYYAGCASAQLAGADRTTTAAGLQARAAHQAVALIDWGDPRAPAWARHWQRLHITTDRTHWTVFYARDRAGPS
jgi:hypothetical protein